MGNLLPEPVADLVAEWPEFRMGVNRVGVQLSDGRWFHNAMVSGSSVVKVLGVEGIPFDAELVVAAVDETEYPLPPGY